MLQLYRANQYVLQRNPDAASALFHLVFEPSSDDERLLYWCAKARFASVASQLDQEDECLEQARGIERRCIRAVRACYELREAVYRRSRKQDQLSLEHALRAEALVADRANTVIQGFAASEIGLSLLRLGNIVGAISRFSNAYSILEHEVSAIQLATLSVTLGLTFSRAEEYQQSIQILSQVVELGPDVIGQRNYCTAVFGIGTANQQLGKHDSAIEQYRILLDQHLESLGAELRMQIVGSLADALCESDKVNEAHELLIGSSSSVDVVSYIAKQGYWGTLGKVLAKSGNVESARQCYQRALMLVRGGDITIRHRMLLEDYIQSGCLTSPDEILAAHQELATTLARQIREQSAAAGEASRIHAAEIQTTIEVAESRRMHELHLISEAQSKMSMAIGSHLHSSTLQELLLLRFSTENLLRADGYSIEDPKVAGELERILEQINNITEQVRDVSHTLHNHFVAGACVGNGLHDYVTYMNRNAPGITIQYRENGVSSVISDELAQSLYRCLQICILNALKHAKCNVIAVSLRWTEHALELTVLDDGIGFTSESAGSDGVGLLELHAHIRRADGRVRIDSPSNVGTTIRMEIPFHHESNNFKGNQQ